MSLGSLERFKQTVMSKEGLIELLEEMVKGLKAEDPYSQVICFEFFLEAHPEGTVDQYKVDGAIRWVP